MSVPFSKILESEVKSLEETNSATHHHTIVWPTVIVMVAEQWVPHITSGT
jgi:hypothetical protein